MDRAESEVEVVLPGYTHLQRAQPVSLAHWWLSHFWPLQRDRSRLAGLAERTAVMPLGSAALAGTPYPVDRFALARELGFSQPCQNSIDGVSDRDFVAEFLFCASLAGIHLSRFCEAVVLYASAEFGFFTLPERFATGSSIMPQKMNPDIFELGRAKAGVLLGNLTGLLAVLKGLPSAYDKDLQEDKVPLFSSFDILSSTLAVLEGAVRSLKVNPERMLNAVSPDMMATDLADQLVERGIPFREAHALAGQVNRLASLQGKDLSQLSRDELASISPLITPQLVAEITPGASIQKRRSYGGTAPEEIKRQLQAARSLLEAGS